MGPFKLDFPRIPKNDLFRKGVGGGGVAGLKAIRRQEPPFRQTRKALKVYINSILRDHWNKLRNLAHVLHILLDKSAFLWYNVSHNE